MGHNSVVSGYSRSTGIPWVNGFSMGPLGFGASQIYSGSTHPCLRLLLLKLQPMRVPLCKGLTRVSSFYT